MPRPWILSTRTIPSARRDREDKVIRIFQWFYSMDRYGDNQYCVCMINKYFLIFDLWNVVKTLIFFLDFSGNSISIQVLREWVVLIAIRAEKRWGWERKVKRVNLASSLLPDVAHTVLTSHVINGHWKEGDGHQSGTFFRPLTFYLPYHPPPHFFGIRSSKIAQADYPTNVHFFH